MQRILNKIRTSVVHQKETLLFYERYEGNCVGLIIYCFFNLNRG